MRASTILVASTIAILGLMATTAPDSYSQTKPNILFFIADDMGWGDAPCYNPDSKIPMPHFDRLAEQGMRFTDAHSPASICAPTRYSAITGNYPWRGLYPGGHWDYKGGSQILQNQWTIADLLKTQGYNTAMFGKLHLGGDFYKKYSNEFATPDNKETQIDFSRGLQNGPLTYGFMYSYLLLRGIQKSPYAYFENDRLVGDPADLFLWVGGTYGNSVIPYSGIGMPYWNTSEIGPVLAQKAVDFIHQHHLRNLLSGTDIPFFIYYASQSAHGPWTPPDFFNGSPITRRRENGNWPTSILTILTIWKSNEGIFLNHDFDDEGLLFSIKYDTQLSRSVHGMDMRCSPDPENTG